MKDKLLGIIKMLFPEDLFTVGERHEKIGALFYEVRDKPSTGDNLWASFFIYDDEPDIVCIEINNVMRKARLEEVNDTVIEAINTAIELREKMAKLTESKDKLIKLEKDRKDDKGELK
jgi:hypothetical protein